MHEELHPDHTHRWRVEDLTQSATPAQLQSVLSRYNRAWRIRGTEEGTAGALIGSRLIGDLLLTNMELSHLIGERDDELVQQESEVYIGVTCPYAGATIVHAGGEEFLLDSSKIHIWTSSHPVDFTVHREVKFVNVIFPEKRLYKRLPGFQPEPLFFDAKMCEVQLITSHLMTLARICETNDGFQESCVSEATIELIANLLRSSEQFSAAGSRKETLWEDVRNFILENLGSDELKPASLADRFGLSVRSIHNLFAGKGMTLMRYIKEQRLEAAKVDLEDPYLREVSITDICYKWAFSDAAHFSHAFKKKYQVSPSEVRRRSIES